MTSDLHQLIVRRLLQIPIILFLVSIIVFLMIHLIPGGPIEGLLGQFASEEVKESMRAQYHLDEPLHIQYWLWLTGVLKGSLGESIITNQPVSNMIISRLPVTLTLVISSLTLSVIIALPAGYISAIHQYEWKDYFATILAFLGLSIPNFFLAIILIKLFSLSLGILPITSSNLFGNPIETAKVFIMPTIALGTAIAAQTTRLLRSEMLEIFNEDYVRVSRAKGLSDKVVNKYIIFRNALIPIITIVALQFGFLLGGTIVIEQVFALPGLGRLMLKSVLRRDFPVIQAIVLIYATGFIFANLIADILYGYVDPRIRYGGEGA